MIRAAIAALLIASPLHAEEYDCDTLPAMVAWLAGDFGETLRATAKHESYALQLWSNDETGTWSVLRIADGQACLTHAGEGGMVVISATGAKS